MVPDGLRWWAGTDLGRDWLGRLPSIVRGCLDAWSLTFEAAVEPGSVAYVARVRLATGAPAILKIDPPDGESDHEARALSWWGPGAAVRVLADDPETLALLLERCEPGDPLWNVPEEAALPIAAGLIRALHRKAPAPGHPFRLLDAEARRWREELPRRWERHGRPFERRLLDRALAAIDELVPPAGLAPAIGSSALLHQDLHGGNILRTSRDGTERWVVIDPKPIVGDPAFDVASLLRDRRSELAADPDAARRVRRRLDLLTDLLGYDRERTRSWGIVHALAWGIGDDAVIDMHVRCARWLAEA